jgi:hypothetical protein
VIRPLGAVGLPYFHRKNSDLETFPPVGTSLVPVGLAPAALGGDATYKIIDLPLTGWRKRLIFRAKPASTGRREVLTPLTDARSRG